MKTIWRSAAIGVALAAISGAAAVSMPDEKGKSESAVFSVWSVPKAGDTMNVTVIGQAKPVAINYTGTTVISGTCIHCVLPLKYKVADSAKNCSACGCDVTNAACIVGPVVKPATWPQTMKDLAYGTVLRITYNEADKPESGAKQIAVDRKTVLLPVDGLSSQTPEQLTTLLKPLGATKLDLKDGATRLTFTVKDWTPALLAKVEKAITGAGGKIVRPEAPIATN